MADRAAAARRALEYDAAARRAAAAPRALRECMRAARGAGDERRRRRRRVRHCVADGSDRVRSERAIVYAYRETAAASGDDELLRGRGAASSGRRREVRVPYVMGVPDSSSLGACMYSIDPHLSLSLCGSPWGAPTCLATHPQLVCEFWFKSILVMFSSQAVCVRNKASYKGRTSWRKAASSSLDDDDEDELRAPVE